MSQVLVVSQFKNWQVDPVDMQPLARHWFEDGSDAERKRTLGGVCFSLLGRSIQSAICDFRKPNYCLGKAFLTGLDFLLCKSLKDCLKKRRGFVKIYLVHDSAALLCLGHCLSWVSAGSLAVSLSPLTLCPAQKWAPG